MEGKYKKMLSLVGKFGNKKFTDALQLHELSPDQAKELFKKNKEVQNFLQQIDQMKQRLEVVNFNGVPFGAPQDYPKAAEIKDILQTSFYMQNVLEVSNACGKVCLVLNKCFDTLGVSNKIVYGVLECGRVKNAHVWLLIGDHVVDNTYVSTMSIENLVALKMAMKYIETDPEKVTDLFSGDEDSREADVPDHTFKAFKWDIQNSDKGLEIMKNITPLKNYFGVMKEFMAKKYDVDIDMSRGVYETCWNCNGMSDKIMKCGKCKVALYCCRECQKLDWNNIHKLICLPPNTF